MHNNTNMTHRATTMTRRRPSIACTVRADRAAGLVVLAELRNTTVSRVVDDAVGLALSAASPAERSAIEAAAKTSKALHESSHHLHAEGPGVVGPT